MIIIMNVIGGHFSFKLLIHGGNFSLKHIEQSGRMMENK